MKLQTETLTEALRHTTQQYADRTALKYRKKNQALTYAQLWERIDMTAKALYAAGIRRGDHIGIWSNNCLEWFHMIFASAKIGAVLVTFNTGFKQLEMEYQLKHSDCKILFFQKHGKNLPFQSILHKTLGSLTYTEQKQILCSSFPTLEKLVCFQENAGSYALTYQEFLAGGMNVSPAELAAQEDTVGSEDTLCMLYTSGTTGSPKGVMLTHFNILNNSVAMLDRFGAKYHDVIDLCLPLFHSFAFTASIGALLIGAEIVVQELFSPEEVLRDMERNTVTYFMGVPTMFVVLLAIPDLSRYRLFALKTAIIGGAPCPESLALDIERVMHIKDIRVGFGITECSPFCFLSRPEDSLQLRTQTVGFGHDYMEARVVDAGNHALPYGTTGELVIRGYNVMRGYYNNNEMTTQAIDSEGWFHTGDAVSMDENGYVRILDRIKDMIIRGGENVYSAEIESVLRRHPAVRAASVIGVPDYKYGEEILAYVVSGSDTDITQELIEFARNNLSDFKVPKYVVMIDNLPINASGKVQKFLLRKMAANHIHADGRASY